MHHRDGRRFIWAIDGWSERRKLPVIRSDSFNLTGSERTWVLSRTSETDSLHLTCSGVRHSPTLTLIGTLDPDVSRSIRHWHSDPDPDAQPHRRNRQPAPHLLWFAA